MQWQWSKFYIYSAEDYLHPAPDVNNMLLEMAEKRGIEILTGHSLKEIAYNSKDDPHRVSELIFEDKYGQTHTLPYDYLAAYPPCKVPETLANSPLVDESSGLIPVDKQTLQHRKYDNVFGLGECTDLPTVNNTISAMNQSHVLSQNVSDKIKG